MNLEIHQTFESAAARAHKLRKVQLDDDIQKAGD